MNDICYKLFTNTETWNLAQEFCTLVQANLASIESEEEADVISGKQIFCLINVVNKRSVPK